MVNMFFTRRKFLQSSLVVSALAPFAGKTEAKADIDTIPLPPAPFPIPDLPPLPSKVTIQNLHSPDLAPFVDELPVPPVLRVKNKASLVAKTSKHKYHRDLPTTISWGYSAEILGPTIEAQRGEKISIDFKNSLGRHVLADHIDTTMHGVTPADKENPRMVVHLHGGITEPSSDGHTMVTYRNGVSATNEYLNEQRAAQLWYHDHAMGITRLNVLAGLAGVYLLRDEYDTGKADNPLKLPVGEFEVPLVVQDRIFNPDGSIQPRMEGYVPTGYNQSGQFGDVACVNGKAWPFMKVKRSVYRFRLLQGSNSRTYNFALSNDMPFYIIGNDQGLLDRPIETKSFVASPGERYDILIDFSQLKPGTKVELINIAGNNFGNTVFAVPLLRNIMQFTITGSRKPARIPKKLRGTKVTPRLLPALPTKVDRVRTITMNGMLDLHRLSAVVPSMMALNNLPFMSDDMDIAKTGTIERWDIVNVTPVDHPIHTHLANFRVIGRRPLLASAYMAAHFPPKFGVRWAPSPEGFYIGDTKPRYDWEAGWKDTVYCPTDMVTSIIVYWPSLKELGFNPDAVIKVPKGGEVIGVEHVKEKGSLTPRVNLKTTAKPVKGYVWHCHNLDHEDHDMMQRIRVVPYK